MTLLLSAVIIISAWLLIIFRITKSTKNKASTFWLSLFLLSISLSLAEPFFESKLKDSYSNFLATFYLFVTGPSLLFYCKSKLKHEKFRKVDTLHFLPLLLYLFSGYFRFSENHFVELVVTESFFIHVMMYCYLSFEVIDDFDMSMNSIKLKRNLKLIKSIPIITGYVYMIIFFVINFNLIINNKVSDQSIYLIQILYSIYILFVIFLLPDFNDDVYN